MVKSADSGQGGEPPQPSGKAAFLDPEAKIQEIAKRAMARPRRAATGASAPLELFAAEDDGCSPKGDRHTMEFPFFSLSKNPDRRIITYKNGNTSITITPSVCGRATIWDKDILLWCASQIMAGLNRGEATSPVIQSKAHKILKFCKRGTGKKAYKDLEKALERLKGTTIETNIKANNRSYKQAFDLVSRWQVVKDNRTGKMTHIVIQLSDWYYSALVGTEVLRVDRAYFSLKGGLHRRLYELARKHCGNQRMWRISIDRLREKCGSSSSIYEFSRMLRDVARNQPLPGYNVRLNKKVAVFTRRQGG